MNRNFKLTVVASLAALSTACAVVPAGPQVTTMPGSGKDFEQFRYDSNVCRDYAHQEVGGQSADQAAVQSGAQGAIIGAVIGALAGAAVGNHRSAAAGAGVGLLFGGVAGAGAAQNSAHSVQQRYDAAYVQCMYAKGHRVPVSGRYSTSEQPPPPPASRSYPPPPPPPAGYPPPPPPR